MLFYAKEIVKQLEGLDQVPQSMAEFERFAVRMLEIDPDSGPARLILAGSAQAAGDLAKAERLAWEGVERLPNSFQSYLSLCRILDERGEEPLTDRLFQFAVWKIGMGEELTPDIEEIGNEIFQDVRGLADPADPMSYYSLALMREDGFKKKRYAAVEKRVLPFRLLNDLQRHAPDQVEAGLVDQILKEGTRCEPIFYSSLRQMVRQGEDLDLPFPLMLIALLGELSGPERISDLLELADFDDGPVTMHACWALWRLGQRYPKEALRAYGEAVPSASDGQRLCIAEQLPELPLTECVTDSLVSLLNDFASRKKDDSAEILLGLVANGLIERNEDELARKVLFANTPLLPKKGRAWIRDVFEGDEVFQSMLLDEGIHRHDIRDICVHRTYLPSLDNFYDQEDQFDEFELSLPPVPKIGRNDPCWCGSGRKYKKCHLESDEAGILPPPNAGESGVVD